MVLDIEGTIAPLAFVSEQLFPYARSHVQHHVESNFASDECQRDVDALRQFVAAELASGNADRSRGLVAIPAASAGKAAVVSAVVASVHALIDQDRKAGPLKQLQGHIWRGGFESGKLVGELFDDLIPALNSWAANGIKTYIYSSGSREAQRMLLAHSRFGDLRAHFSGFFDTAVGAKVEASSYSEIYLTLGLDDPAEIMFATDNVREAEAAVAAGWRCCLVDRPGNNPLPPSGGLPAGVPVIKSMGELLSRH